MNDEEEIKQGQIPRSQSPQIEIKRHTVRRKRSRSRDSGKLDGHQDNKWFEPEGRDLGVGEIILLESVPESPRTPRAVNNMAYQQDTLLLRKKIIIRSESMPVESEPKTLLRASLERVNPSHSRSSSSHSGRSSVSGHLPEVRVGNMHHAEIVVDDEKSPGVGRGSAEDSNRSASPGRPMPREQSPSPPPQPSFIERCGRFCGCFFWPFIAFFRFFSPKKNIKDPKLAEREEKVSERINQSEQQKNWKHFYSLSYFLSTEYEPVQRDILKERRKERNLMRDDLETVVEWFGMPVGVPIQTKLAAQAVLREVLRKANKLERKLTESNKKNDNTNTILGEKKESNHDPCADFKMDDMLLEEMEHLVDEAQEAMKNKNEFSLLPFQMQQEFKKKAMQELMRALKNGRLEKLWSGALEAEKKFKKSLEAEIIPQIGHEKFVNLYTEWKKNKNGQQKLHEKENENNGAPALELVTDALRGFRNQHIKVRASKL